MPKTPAPPHRPARAARLTTDAVLGLTGLVEALHARIASLPGTPGPAHGRAHRPRLQDRARHDAVEGAVPRHRWLAGTALLAPEADAAQAEGHREREAVVAALNGVLATTWSPRATRWPSRCNCAWTAARCCWTRRPAGPPARRHAPRAGAAWPVHERPAVAARRARPRPDPGAGTGYTPVYLHYNTGLHIADNGQQLAALLQRLTQAWPVPVERPCCSATALAASARSALHCASSQPGLHWPALVSDLVCLGTLHLAPRSNAWVTPWTTSSAPRPTQPPLPAFGTLRSAGITDLRHGSITAPTVDGAHPTVPVAEQRARYALAAHLGPATDHLKAARSATASCP